MWTLVYIAEDFKVNKLDSSSGTSGITGCTKSDSNQSALKRWLILSDLLKVIKYVKYHKKMSTHPNNMGVQVIQCVAAFSIILWDFTAINQVAFKNCSRKSSLNVLPLRMQAMLKKKRQVLPLENQKVHCTLFAEKRNNNSFSLYTEASIRYTCKNASVQAV